LILGHGLVLRRPDRISLGDSVAMDDNVKFDASGSRASGITIDDDVIISRNCIIQAKSGSVIISSRLEEIPQKVRFSLIEALTQPPSIVHVGIAHSYTILCSKFRNYSAQSVLSAG
jgi:acetyltransferase-like isoleucine patch superfamily enzyme